MAGPVRVTWDSRGMTQVVNSQAMQAMCVAMAEAGRAHAVSISPRSSREHKHYADSFVVRKVKINDPRGGRRAGAVLANTADHAGAVEWGTQRAGRKLQQASNVLSRTVSFIEGAS
ncbi:MAG TPA: hypothetical protein VGF17_10025 [Phytomonospora sp.]